MGEARGTQAFDFAGEGAASLGPDGGSGCGRGFRPLPDLLRLRRELDRRPAGGPRGETAPKDGPSLGRNVEPGSLVGVFLDKTFLLLI